MRARRRPPPLPSWRTPRAWLPGLLLGLALAACSATDADEAACGADTTCPAACYAGACRDACKVPADCPADHVCARVDPGLLCLPADALPACGTDDDCQGLLPGTCQRAACDATTGRCALVAQDLGAPCGAGGLCYEGTCRTACADSSACDPIGAGLVCANRRLGPGVTAGLCVPIADVPCQDDEACLELLPGPCRSAGCDAGAGHCRLDEAPDGSGCEDLGQCYQGSCHPMCDVRDRACPTGLACVEPAPDVAICVAAGAVPCAVDDDCGALVVPMCHRAACADGTCRPWPTDNGSACAEARTCWDGRCVGSGPCAADAPCAQGRACVQGQGGRVCVPVDDLRCAADDDCAPLRVSSCHVPTCDGDTQRCVAAPSRDGASCGESLACLGGACAPVCAQGDACPEPTLCVPFQDGAPQGACVEVPCASASDCEGLLEEPGPCERLACSALAKRCQRVPRPDLEPCDDGDLCNGVQRCVQGVCSETTPAQACPEPPAGSCTSIACDPASGACTAEAAPDGTPCEDDSPCTSDSTCKAGVCRPGAVLCQTCAYDPDCLGDDDGDRCNGVPVCLDGVCAWSPQTVVVCAPSQDPCLARVCDPATGDCVDEPLPEGTPCPVSEDRCEARFSCQQGACAVEAPSVSCASDDDPCTREVCDPDSGACLALPLPELVLATEGFEEGDLGGFTVTENTGEAQGAGLGLSDDTPHEGAHALRLGTGPAWSPDAEPFDLVAEGPPIALADAGPVAVALGLRVALDPAAGDAFTVEASQADGTWRALLVADAANPGPVGAGWLAVQRDVPSPADPLRLRVHLHGSGGTAQAPHVDLDALRVVRVCP